MKRVTIDVKKTVVLFVAVHLMIAWVAERKEARKEHKSFLVRSADVANKINKKMDKQFDILGMLPYNYIAGRTIK